MTLSNAQQAALASEGTTATATIVDNDAAELSVLSDGNVSEDAGSATFTVKLSLASSRTVTVAWATGDGTATAGDDYTAGSGSLTFSAGTLTRTISVAVTDDAVDEENETFKVTLSNPSQAALAGSGGDTAEATILDNDARAVTVAPTALTVAEGGSAPYTVELESEPTANVTVTVTVPTGTDVTTSPTALTFTAANWETAQTVTVTAAEDMDAVADPPVTITHAVAGGDYGANSVTAEDVVVTVVENDTPTLSVISDGDVDEAAGSATFTVKLSLASSDTVTVDWTTGNGTATAGDDYTAGSGSLTFSPGGGPTQTVTVTVTDDAVDEPDETFTVTLSNAAHAALAGGGDTVSADWKILDDDERGVTVEPTALTVAEGGSAPYTVVLESEPTEDVTVEVTVPGGTDVSTNATELTFTASDWETAQTVTVMAAEDNNAVADEPVTITHAVAGGDYAGETAENVEVTVVENDTPVLSIVSDGDVSEAAGSATFTVELSLASSDTVTVDWKTADGTATAASDYTAVTNGSLTFSPDGALEQTVSVTVTDDAVDEADETFTVTLSDAQQATLAGGEATASADGKILDDDGRGVTVEPTALTVAEGGSAPYTVVLESEPTEDVTVEVTVPGGTDVSTNATELTFTASDWETAQTVTVTAAEDNDAVADEPVTITHAVAGGDYAGETAESVVVTVEENDTPVLSVASDGDVQEDAGSATFTVKLSLAISDTVTVDWATADGTATAGIGLHGGDEWEPDVQSGRRAGADGERDGDRRCGGRGR